MKNKLVFPTLIIILIIISTFIYQNNKNVEEISQVCIKDKCFSVELAKTDTERQKGLSNRTYLDKNAGMLFIFSEPAIYNFWMKDTLIPLDIIWISNDKIVYIERNAQPCLETFCPIFNPKQTANYVLEINGNLTSEYNISEGEIVSFVRSKSP